jgi:hypothetical protein
MFSVGKSSPNFWATPEIEKMAKQNCQLGEKSPNLVTLKLANSSNH